MAYRVLEVTLISAKDLKKVTLFSKMRIYAVASISGGDPRLPTHRTNADHDGGRSPTWNASLYFPIPAAANPRGLALHVLLRSERVFGDRDVGEVFIPLEDLLAGAPNDGEGKSVSYQVRRPMSGRARGVLQMSYKFSDIPADATAVAGFQEATKGPAMYNNAAHAKTSEKPMAKGMEPVTAYPAARTAYPPQQAAYPQAMPYGAPYAGYSQQPYGYASGPSYGYNAPPPAYGYGAPQAAPPARHGGMGMGLGIGLLGGALGGMLLGDMIGDADVDAAYDAGFDDGLGF